MTLQKVQLFKNDPKNGMKKKNIFLRWRKKKGKSHFMHRLPWQDQLGRALKEVLLLLLNKIPQLGCGLFSYILF